MKQRKIHIDGGKQWHVPKVAVIQGGQHVFAPLPAVDEFFNFASNNTRDPGSPIRFGNDYWPVVRTHRALRVDGNPTASSSVIEYPIFEKIDPVPRPGGCDEVWHVLPDYGPREEAPERVWAIVVRTSGGSLRDIFVRSGLRQITNIPFDISQFVSENIRPLHKIRFPTYDYFVPEREFMYVGYPYR